MKEKISPIQQPVRVINMGLERFSEDLRKAEVDVIQMDWRPPAGGDRKLIALLDSLDKQM
ncbi:MAG: fdrA domain protein [Desulfobacterales bacterium]|nr:fdrA domain protein [Desulfobacterales bacterium]